MLRVTVASCTLAVAVPGNVGHRGALVPPGRVGVVGNCGYLRAMVFGLGAIGGWLAACRSAGKEHCTRDQADLH